MNAYLEAETGYRTTTGAAQQHWFDRRVEIVAAFTARFGSWPDPKRSAEDPAVRPYRTPTADEIKAFTDTTKNSTKSIAKALRPAKRPSMSDAKTDSRMSGRPLFRN
jgi:hypothetical protein